MGATMAEILTMKPKDTTEAEPCQRMYENMNFDPSNLVFAPAFCTRASRRICAPYGGPARSLLKRKRRAPWTRLNDGDVDLVQSPCTTFT